jgi:MFS superfamily sulfate permease-like transporter
VEREDSRRDRAGNAGQGCRGLPALAGLLILIGYRTIKPRELWSVWKTGVIQKTVLATSFALTMLIPLQYAVLAGSACRWSCTWSASPIRSPSNASIPIRTGT